MGEEEWWKKQVFQDKLNGKVCIQWDGEAWELLYLCQLIPESPMVWLGKCCQCTCVFQLDCKGYCLCSGLHSIKGSCLQSRFFFLFWGYLCISILPQNCYYGIAEQNMHPVKGVSFRLWISEFDCDHLPFFHNWRRKISLWELSLEIVRSQKHSCRLTYSSYCSI